MASAAASGGTGGTYALQNYTYNPDTGNLASNAGVTYTYGDNAHKHAVTGTSNGNIYSYDANGNQTSRRVSGTTYTLIYDAESRLVQVKLGKTIQATYTYDGDGNRVKTVVGSTTTTYIGNYLERECINTTCTLKRYYYAAGQRVALRKGDGTLYFLLTDHLGSTAITATSSGGRDAELRYYPWGGTRYTYGTTPTSYRYTGQREAEVGLYYYGARFYDPALGRFVQADTIIPNPGDPPSFDRFAYVRNNPIKYTDPTGHWYYDPGCDCLVDTHESYNEHPEYLDREPLPTPEFELPPPVSEKYQDQLSESQWNLARWAYAVYWSNPTLFTYNEFVWFWAWAYWEYSAAYYDLDEPWFTPPDMAPFMVPNFVELAGTIGATMGGMLGGPIPNRIGNAGTSKVGTITNWEIRQIRMPGGGRIYDGRIYGTNIYLEIKTTTRGTIYPNAHIRSQIAYDLDVDVLWIFVGGDPSTSLVNMLDAAGISWMVLP